MRTLSTLALVGLACLSSCSGPGSAQEDSVTGDTTALVATINAKRDAIEQRLESLARKTLPTTGLREQIKQKWSKIDFYVDGNAVVRLKTYPHPGVSTRTEEFYFDGGQLIYANIQDRGVDAHERGGAHAAGKEYYYSHGKFVAEHNQSGESEHTIRHSDEERLEQEAMEYLDLFARMK